MAVSSSATPLEHAATDLIAGDQAEEAFDLAEPGGGCRSEVHMEARMFCQPRLDLGMLVGGVVVGDQMQVELLGRLGVDTAQEFQPFLMAVPLHAVADDLAGGDVERGEQCRRAVALVVMRHGAGSALLDRQAGLCAVERLDLALLVDRENQRLVRRIEIETDDIAHLLDEVLVIRQLEGLHQVRLEAVRLPDPLHAGVADTDRAECLTHVGDSQAVRSLTLNQ